MQKETFINNMKERGYSISATINGNIKATKEDITVRLVPLANYGVHIDTPTVAAITAKDTTDAETLRIIDALTIQP